MEKPTFPKPRIIREDFLPNEPSSDVVNNMVESDPSIVFSVVAVDP